MAEWEKLYQKVAFLENECFCYAGKGYSFFFPSPLPLFFFSSKCLFLFCRDFKQFTSFISSLVIFGWFLHVALEIHLRLCLYLCPYGLSLEMSFCLLRARVYVVIVLLLSLLPFLFPAMKALPFFFLIIQHLNLFVLSW